MAYSAIGGFPQQQLVLQKERQDWVGKCKSRWLETKEVSDSHRKYDNHVFLVYMHVNKINGKVYVGITHHVNPNKRWGYSGQLYTHCKKFVNAINKYGWNNFDHIILCRTTRERAIIMEQTLIAHYKKLGISYNIANGGEGSKAVSDETKEKLKKIKSANPAMKGRHHTPEAKARIAEAGRNREMKDSTRQKLKEKVWSKMSNIHTYITPEGHKKTAQKLSMSVIQMDLEGNIIREFPSTIAADMFINNGKRRNHIADVCNGKRKSANGYKWMYKEERRPLCI